MSSPAVKSPGYQKYVLRWDERPAAGTHEYEATQSRILQVFREWSMPEGLTVHQFVIRVGNWGGYANGEPLQDLVELTKTGNWVLPGKSSDGRFQGPAPVSAT
jgi:hypothetical protein